MNIAPGDICNATNGDTCNKGTCVNSVCVSSNSIGSNCVMSADCPLGAYCNWTSYTCAPTVAPGGACSAGNSQMQADECGYQGYCINSVCILPYTLPPGNTNIFSNTSNFYQLFVNMLCSTGAAAIDPASNNFFCVNPPFTNPSYVSKGQPSGT